MFQKIISKSLIKQLDDEKLLRIIKQHFFNQDLVFSYYELTRDLLNDEP